MDALDQDEHKEQNNTENEEKYFLNTDLYMISIY